MESSRYTNMPGFFISLQKTYHYGRKEIRPRFNQRATDLGERNAQQQEIPGRGVPT